MRLGAVGVEVSIAVHFCSVTRVAKISWPRLRLSVSAGSTSTSVWPPTGAISGHLVRWLRRLCSPPRSFIVSMVAAFLCRCLYGHHDDSRDRGCGWLRSFTLALLDPVGCEADRLIRHDGPWSAGSAAVALTRHVDLLAAVSAVSEFGDHNSTLDRLRVTVMTKRS